LKEMMPNNDRGSTQKALFEVFWLILFTQIYFINPQSFVKKLLNKFLTTL